ncbi:hypothetical protein PILCRDRAFT_826473 [Piloderma croceum F 1598]|uniref:Uncharacterized protein n=1 Tax=Piloderma croceum (strain F 1598) TaxID=765440 RepID=A0A0C3BG14_PILCF|nr:hypothetical protein PILCRDRAFT_826473 [Piloderma croceum F 1598]
MVDYTPTYFDILDFANAIDSRMVSNGEGQASNDIAGLRTVKIRCLRVLGAVNSTILSPLREGDWIGDKSHGRASHIHSCFKILKSG